MGRSAKKKTNTHHSNTKRYIDKLPHIRQFTEATLDQNLNDIVSEFYSLSKSLKDDDQNMKNYMIIRLTTIVEQLIRQAVEYEIKKSNSLKGITEKVTIEANVLMEMQDATKERIIASSFNFQNTERINKVMKNLYNQSVFKCGETKYMTSDFKKLFNMRHDIVHNVLGKGNDVCKYYEKTEKLMQNTLNIIHGHNNNFYYYKAHALSDLERYEDAIQCFYEALRLDPNDLYVYIHLGSLLDKYGENKARKVFLENGMAHFDKEIKSDSRNVSLHIGKGILFENSKEYEEAVECFNRAIDLESKNITAYIHKGLSLMDLMKYEEAISCFDSMIKLQPKDYEAHIGKGTSLMRLKKYEEAIVVFDETIMINPESDEAYMNKGYIYANRDRHKIAIIYLDKAIERNPKNWRAHMRKGFSFAELKMYKESMECFDSAIMRNLEKENSYMLKADTLMMLERPKEAVACLDKAIRTCPNAEMYRMRDSILKRLRKHD